MKKVVIYPYDISNIHLILYNDLASMPNAIITSCLSPKGWGYDGEDAGEKIGLSTGIYVKSDFEEVIKEADILLLSESIFPISDEDIFSKIESAVKCKKKVIILRQLNESVRKEILSTLDEKIIIHTGNEIDIKTNTILESYENSIEDVPAPVILVIGTGERCCKYDVQLELRKVLLKNGFTVSQIGSKQYCEFFGFHSFPCFMLDNSTYNESEKIMGFNKYIRTLYKLEKPDVFVIGVPGGVFPYDSEFHNRFGMTNFLVANAISPDYVIFNSLYVERLREYLDELTVQLVNRFNYEVDKIFVSNCAMNLYETKRNKELTYISCKTSSIKNKTQDLNVYNVFDTSDKDKVMLSVVNTLSEYADLTII